MLKLSVYSHYRIAVPCVLNRAGDQAAKLCLGTDVMKAHLVSVFYGASLSPLFFPVQYS